MLGAGGGARGGALVLLQGQALSLCLFDVSLSTGQQYRPQRDATVYSSQHVAGILGGALQVAKKKINLFLTFWAPKLLQMVIAAMKLKHACYLEENLWPT